MKIKGFSIRPEKPGECALVWRFYGTREVFVYPDGRVRPQPGTWELVCEVVCTLRRGRLTMPEFELEETREGGWRFYQAVAVGRDGRERWHAGEEIVLTREMVEVIERHRGEVDFAHLELYNLELKGVIAPGQL